MTRIWLVNWHFQSRIILWCRHKSTNVSMGLCWQIPKFIVWRLWSIYFDHHLPLKPSIGKRRKQSCTPNKFKIQLLLEILIYIYINILYILIYIKVMRFSREFSPRPDPFLEYHRFVNLTIHFTRVKSSLILFLRAIPFILHCLLEWWGGGEKIGKIGRSSITGRIVFHILFML